MIMKSTESGTVKWKSLENYEMKSNLVIQKKIMNYVLQKSLYSWDSKI